MKKKKTWETVPGGNERAKAHHKRIMRRQYKHLSIMLAILIPIIVFKHVFGLNKPPAPVVEEVSPSYSADTAKFLEAAEKYNPMGGGMIGKNDMEVIGIDGFPEVNFVATRSRKTKKFFRIAVGVRLRDTKTSQDYLITAAHLFVDPKTKELRKGDVLSFGMPGVINGHSEHFKLDMEQIKANDYAGNDIMVIQIPYTPHLPAFAIKPKNFVETPGKESAYIELVSVLAIRDVGTFKVKQLAVIEDASFFVHDDLLMTSADMFKGVSGSPAFTKDGAHLVGLASQTVNRKGCQLYREDNLCYNLISVVNFDLIQKERELRTAPLERILK
jgi:hypothetical protein